MYKIQINKQPEREIFFTSDEVVINGKKIAWDLRTMADGTFSILAGGKSYTAIVEHVEREKKELLLRINGHLYQLQIREPIDQLLQKMGLHMATEKKAEPIKAPMPGLVLKIMVEAGQQIKKGDPVLILEAMKMENVFKAPSEAIVKAVKIREGQAVEKGTVLIELA